LILQLSPNLLTAPHPCCFSYDQSLPPVTSPSKLSCLSVALTFQIPNLESIGKSPSPVLLPELFGEKMGSIQMGATTNRWFLILVSF
jgi:hypothetical protein